MKFNLLFLGVEFTMLIKRISLTFLFLVVFFSDFDFKFIVAT